MFQLSFSLSYDFAKLPNYSNLPLTVILEGIESIGFYYQVKCVTNYATESPTITQAHVTKVPGLQGYELTKRRIHLPLWTGFSIASTMWSCSVHSYTKMSEEYISHTISHVYFIAGSLESAYSLNWGPERFGERVEGRPWHFYYK